MTEHLTLEQTAQRLKEHDFILVLCHKNPDGDTVGCGAALCKMLRMLGKEAAVFCSDPLPTMYSYMNIPMYEEQWKPEYIVAVDVAGIQLFGDAAQQYVDRVDLCIDHHATNSGYADATYVDGDSAAAAEIMVELVEPLGLELTPELADCLYTGIVTDTGCFRFSSTTARTHRMTARLMEAGARAAELNALLFENRSKGRMVAEKIALQNMEYHFDDRCALTYLTREEIRDSGVAPAELEDLTSLPRTIEGVDVGVTLRQQPGGSYKISVRTTSAADARAIAMRLGGGGHVKAAGCELMGNLDNTKAAILAEVERELQRQAEKE
ncbi:MAG: bifunctional oligoribonuclease/PAP phosphatase NrnA [Oscillospiraceae bacterium]|nr:bifunctional oligoribonuclease/PAP phosphatase NrnA [Oscillospiraceae bacterium]